MKHPHPQVRGLKVLHDFAQRTLAMRVSQNIAVVPVLCMVLPDMSGHCFGWYLNTNQG